VIRRVGLNYFAAVRRRLTRLGLRDHGGEDLYPRSIHPDLPIESLPHMLFCRHGHLCALLAVGHPDRLPHMSAARLQLGSNDPRGPLWAASTCLHIGPRGEFRHRCVDCHFAHAHSLEVANGNEEEDRAHDHVQPGNAVSPLADARSSHV
jgi:hypothetical protein